MAYSSHKLFPTSHSLTLIRPLDSLSRWCVALSITGYQKYISPYKGYHCAHRVLYGSRSCSEFVKKMVQRYGVQKGFQLALRRFRACGEAHHSLKTQGYAQTVTNLMGQSLVDTLSGAPVNLSKKDKDKGCGCFQDNSCDDITCCCIELDTNPCNGCGSLNDRLSGLMGFIKIFR